MTNEQLFYALLAVIWFVASVTAMSMLRDIRKYLDAKIDPIAARLDRLEKLVRGY